MRVHKFAVGQQVRRSRKWWPEAKHDAPMLIIAQEIGEDNNGRKNLGYRIEDKECFPKNGCPFLEEELEAIA